MQVLTYVPSNVVLLISGYQIEGWTKIAVSRNSPNFKQIRGIRGKNTRTRIKDSSATLQISTFQTELLNEVLSKCLEADIANGTVRLEVALSESTGGSFFSSTTAYIVGYPELVHSSELGEVQWTLVCDDSKFFVGAAKSAAAGIVAGGVSRLKSFASDAADFFN